MTGTGTIYSAFENSTLSLLFRLYENGSNFDKTPEPICWGESGAGYPNPGVLDVVLTDNPDNGKATFTLTDAAGEIVNGLEDHPFTISCEDPDYCDLVFTILRGLPIGVYKLVATVDTTASTTLPNISPFAVFTAQYQYKITVKPLSQTTVS